MSSKFFTRALPLALVITFLLWIFIAYSIVLFGVYAIAFCAAIFFIVVAFLLAMQFITSPPKGFYEPRKSK